MANIEFHFKSDSNDTTGNTTSPGSTGDGNDNEEKDNSSSGFLTAMVTGYTNMLRGLILFIALIGAILLLMYMFRRIYVPKQAVTSAEITNSGVIFKFAGGNKSITYVNFHSSLLWLNEPIDYDPEETLTIKASGQYNPSIYHIVEAARSDSIPVFGWCGPEGIPGQHFNRLSDSVRGAHRIAKEANYACLLLQFVPDHELVKNRPAPQNLIVIGKGKELPAKTFGSKGKLYFAVNEIPLDASMGTTYIVTKKEDPEYVKKRSEEVQKKAWDYIVKKKYWNLWYDDNIGSIFITIEKENAGS